MMLLLFLWSLLFFGLIRFHEFDVNRLPPNNKTTERKNRLCTLLRNGNSRMFAKGYLLSGSDSSNRLRSVTRKCTTIILSKQYWIKVIGHLDRKYRFEWIVSCDALAELPASEFFFVKVEVDNDEDEVDEQIGATNSYYMHNSIADRMDCCANYDAAQTVCQCFWTKSSHTILNHTKWYIGHINNFLYLFRKLRSLWQTQEKRE